MRHINIYTKRFFIILSIFLFSMIISSSVSLAGSVKIRYNNTTYKYNGPRIKTFIDGKKVRPDTTKGLRLNKTVMVSYKDIFKNGCGIKTTYNKKTGKLIFKANGNTVKMKLGSKKVTVNKKTKKVKQAPVKVKFVKKKKNNIYVPAKILFKAFDYTYEYSAMTQTISSRSPFVLYYNNSYHVYESYYGGITYNNLSKDMSTMPVLSINNTEMLPAETVIKDIMGLDYSFDASTGDILIKNNGNVISLKLGSNDALIGEKDLIKLPCAPIVVKRMDTGYQTVMLPAEAVITALGYYYTWNNEANIINIHTKTHFSWNASEVKYDKRYSNALISAEAVYDMPSNSVIMTYTFDKLISNDIITNINNISSEKLAYFDIPDTFNLLGDNSCLLDSERIYSVNLGQTKNEDDIPSSTRILITFTSNTATYTYTIEENKLIITIPEDVSGAYGIKLVKPEGLEYEKILYTDNYFNKQYIISIPGDYASFYNTSGNNIYIMSKNITDVSVTYNTVTGYTDILVTTSKIQGFKAVNLSKTIEIIVDDPAKVFDNIVVLDPGHGGNDPGAVSAGFNESDMNYAILYTYGKEFFNTSTEEHVKAYWTRTTDTFITLNNRAAFAASVGADLFVSLHMNSSTSSAAKGTEVFYAETNNTVTVNGLNSSAVAQIFQNNLVTNLKTTDRGVKKAGYYVIKNNTVPAVLIELGFISNETDRAMITNPEMQKKVASIIYNSVLSVFNVTPSAKQLP